MLSRSRNSLKSIQDCTAQVLASQFSERQFCTIQFQRTYQLLWFFQLLFRVNSSRYSHYTLFLSLIRQIHFQIKKCAGSIFLCRTGGEKCRARQIDCKIIFVFLLHDGHPNLLSLFSSPFCLLLSCELQWQCYSEMKIHEAVP